MRREKSQPTFTIEALNVIYQTKRALTNVNLEIPPRQITALVGPSGSGKSTFLRCLNRMNNRAQVEGKIWYQGIDVNQRNINVYALRRHVGLVFQHPNPFAKTIRNNFTHLFKRVGIKAKHDQEQQLRKCLEAAALWEEVQDQLDTSALQLSGGQAQRLCIARALATNPNVLLLDEPASALDPISTAKLEDTLLELRQRYTIIIVTHNLQQASRISDQTAFFHQGHLIEIGKTDQLFLHPQRELTAKYLAGAFG